MGCNVKTIRQSVLGFVIAVAGLLPAAAFAATCSENKVELRGDWGQARFTIEIADDPAERGVGLMNRDKMSMSAGMLFIYDKPQHVSFWMKNTLIPLDLIFMDASGTVTRVHDNAIPLDLTGIDGGENVLTVLEINGGLAKSMGISVGSQLRHPRIDQEIAVWRCDTP